jgi:hypothetical protein
LNSNVSGRTDQLRWTARKSHMDLQLDLPRRTWSRAVVRIVGIAGNCAEMYAPAATTGDPSVAKWIA